MGQLVTIKREDWNRVQRLLKDTPPANTKMLDGMVPSNPQIMTAGSLWMTLHLHPAAVSVLCCHNVPFTSPKEN